VVIPSMTLQPIVENCIKHGFHEVEWEKHIDLSVTGEDGNIVISIRDNGRGITPEKIRSIFRDRTKDEQTVEDPESGIGMGNVLTRLRSFYNKEDVLEITSVGPDMGTEVAIFIPEQTKET